MGAARVERSASPAGVVNFNKWKYNFIMPPQSFRLIRTAV